MALHDIPFIERLAVLAVEVEAAGMALSELRQCGILRAQDAGEAALGLLSHAAALFALGEK